ncbi:glycosyltransferase family A protein [Clostridium saccharoperbutylacetonicum]|nr:glycosyltransferase family A protein [Clostridium saccharoperbutylacetonicum]
MIPAYNQTNYLEQALDSALNQSYRNTEIIICTER